MQISRNQTKAEFKTHTLLNEKWFYSSETWEGKKNCIENTIKCFCISLFLIYSYASTESP